MRVRIPLPGPFSISHRVRRTGITLRNINAVRAENRERRARVRRNLSNRAYAKELRRKKILY
jgi:hypothetical protein